MESWTSKWSKLQIFIFSILEIIIWVYLLCAPYTIAARNIWRTGTGWAYRSLGQYMFLKLFCLQPHHCLRFVMWGLNSYTSNKILNLWKAVLKHFLLAFQLFGIHSFHLISTSHRPLKGVKPSFIFTFLLTYFLESYIIPINYQG